MGFELQKQKAYIQKLTDFSLANRNLFSEFDTSGMSLFFISLVRPTVDINGARYINQLVINSENGDISCIQEKWFPYQLYDKNKFCQKVVKLKQSDNKFNNLNLLGNINALILDNQILEWVICVKKLDISNLIQLNWMHTFHPDWIKNLIEERVK
jgi:hypothetical protein